MLVVRMVMMVKVMAFVCRITGSMAAGLLGAGMFSFSRLTWTWSVTAEVFALNNLLVALLLVVAVYFNQCAQQEKAKVWSVRGYTHSGLFCQGRER